MIVLKIFKCVFADILYLICGKRLKAVISADVDRYLKWNKKIGNKKNRVLRLDYLLVSKPDFRSVFYFRTARHKILTALSGLLLPRAKSIEFDGEIGGGLMVSHYHSVICPKSAGRNLRVGPGAVICGDDGAPVIGDNVYVASNSCIIGNIHIGDNVIIGAGSVVKDDLAGNAVYVGNPARFIKNIDGNEALLNEIM